MITIGLTVGATAIMGAPDWSQWQSLANYGRLFARGSDDFARSNSPRPIILQLSQVWEGAEINPSSLAAIQEFRSQFSSISITHFLNPAYYTKPGADAESITAKILSTMRAGDATGMTLNGWRSLVQDSGLIFRDSPTFWGNTLSARDCQFDCGHEVPLSSYSEEELVKLMEHSAKLLVDQGFSRPTGFRAGGWMATPQVLSAAARSGFLYEFSAVPPELISGRLQHFPLGRWLKALWQDQTPLAQPRVIQVQGGSITKVGNSAAAIDYLTERQVSELYRAYVAAHRAAPHRGLLFHLSFHHESAAQHLPRLARVLQDIFAISQESRIPLQPMTVTGPVPIASMAPVSVEQRELSGRANVRR